MILTGAIIYITIIGIVQIPFSLVFFTSLVTYSNRLRGLLVLNILDKKVLYILKILTGVSIYISIVVKIAEIFLAFVLHSVYVLFTY